MSLSTNFSVKLSRMEAFSRLKLAAEGLGFEMHSDSAQIWFERYRGRQLTDVLEWEINEVGPNSNVELFWTKHSTLFHEPSDPRRQIEKEIGEQTKLQDSDLIDPAVYLTPYPRPTQQKTRHQRSREVEMKNLPIPYREDLPADAGAELSLDRVRAFAHMLRYSEVESSEDHVLFWRGDPLSAAARRVGYFQCPSLLEARIVRKFGGDRVTLRTASWWSNSLAGCSSAILRSEMRDLRAYVRSGIRPTMQFAVLGRSRRLARVGNGEMAAVIGVCISPIISGATHMVNGNRFGYVFIAIGILLPPLFFIFLRNQTRAPIALAESLDVTKLEPDLFALGRRPIPPAVPDWVREALKKEPFKIRPYDPFPTLGRLG